MQQSDFVYLSVTEFRSPMRFAFVAEQSVAVLAMNVLRVGNVLKVLRPVIQFVTVEVIYDLTLRREAEESSGYNLVNTELLPLTTIRQIDVQVAALGNRLNDPLPNCTEPFVASDYSGQAFNSS